MFHYLVPIIFSTKKIHNAWKIRYMSGKVREKCPFVTTPIQTHPLPCFKFFFYHSPIAIWTNFSRNNCLLSFYQSFLTGNGKCSLGKKLEKLIQSADPQSRPVVIPIFASGVCTSVRHFSKSIKTYQFSSENSYRYRRGSLMTPVLFFLYHLPTLSFI